MPNHCSVLPAPSGRLSLFNPLHSFITMKKTNSLFIKLALATLVASPLAALASGGTFTWNGGGGDGNWSTGANWGGSGPSDPQNTLNFAGSTRLANTNDFSAGSSGHRLFFNSGASAFTLAGNSVTFYDFGGANQKLENNSSSLQTINFPIVNGNNASGAFEINPVSGDLTLGSTLNNGGFDLNIYGSNSKMLTLGGTVSGAGKLIIKQYSKVKVSGTSTWTGNTEIDTGEFWIGLGGRFTSNSTIYVGNGGQLANVAKVWLESAGLVITNPIVVNAGNANTRSLGGLNTSGIASNNSAISLSAPVILEANQAGGTIRFGGIISGAQNVLVTGPGTVTLAGVNTYSGTTTVSNGTASVIADTGVGAAPGAITAGSLNLNTGTYSAQATFTMSANRGIALGSATAGSGGTFDVGSGFTLTTAGRIANNGNTNSLTKTGAGTLSLLTNNSYSGNTVINGGILLANYNGSLLAGGVPILYSNITVGRNMILNAATFQISSKASQTSAHTNDTTVINPGASVIQELTRQSSGTETIQLGTISRNPGGTVDLLPQSGTSGTQTSATGIRTPNANGSSGIFAGWCTYNTFAEWAVKNGSANLYGGATYTPNTASSLGTVNQNSDISGG
ncbi:MAG: hypothetical protein RL380_596, partial [Verrucomicrobiota bacterium]